MSNQNNYSRRRFLAQSGLGLAAFAAMPGFLRAMEGMQAMPKLAPNKASPNFKPDVEFDLFSRSSSVSILPGQQTMVQQYAALLKDGPKDTITDITGSYLGPIIRLQKGQKVRINLHNKLAEPTVTHWHGLHVPANMDGHPMYAIDPGETLVYEFEVLNRAGMNIYHPHPHEATAKQVYNGLAGALFVHDEEEAKLELPSGEFEIPLVIQDRLFDELNQLIYVRGMHDRMTGFYGDRILVNGSPDFKIDVASRAYRLRFLNGSTARIYKLGWDDGTPITVIGVDGGLLEKPEVKPYVMLAPGERLDVWADFSGRNEGTQLVMRSLPFSGALPKMAERMMGGGMGMMHHNKIPVGSEYPIFTARVTKKVSDSPKLPSQLSKINWHPISAVANPDKPVPIGISEGPMAMLLNGRPYAYNDIQDFERIKLNTIQLMEIFHAHGGGGGHGKDSTPASGEHGVEKQSGGMGGMGHQGGGMGMMGGMMHGGDDQKGGGMMGMGGMGMMGGMKQGGEGQKDGGQGMDHNGGGMGMMGGMKHGGGDQKGGGMMGMGGMGMMMSMAHPIHLHGQQFQIVSRSISADEEANYATVRDGFIESGLKDVVLVMPGEKVRIIKPFQDFKGLFMYHCHNLEHEDMGMMRDFLVE
ncbi:MAG: multicopper oxidase domain-containing protein [Methylococcales bacterium]|nr:multicopper oxidase domain-containing protein [Methylococcales bacterium]